MIVLRRAANFARPLYEVTAAVAFLSLCPSLGIRRRVLGVGWRLTRLRAAARTASGPRAPTDRSVSSIRARGGGRGRTTGAAAAAAVGYPPSTSLPSAAAAARRRRRGRVPCPCYVGAWRGSVGGRLEAGNRVRRTTYRAFLFPYPIHSSDCVCAAHCCHRARQRRRSETFLSFRYTAYAHQSSAVDLLLFALFFFFI